MKRIFFAVLVAVLATSACWAEESITETLYTRSKGNGTWGTLCLPRQITAVTGATLYVPYYGTKDGDVFTTLYLKQATLPVAAGTPVMFKYTSSTLTATLTGVAVNKMPDDVVNNMVGNLSSTPLSVDNESDCYVLTWTWNNSSDHNQGGKDIIRKVESPNVTIPQYRAYFDFSDIPSAKPDESTAKVVCWELGGGVIDDATGIEETRNLETKKLRNTEIYNLVGQKVTSSSGTHGIMIINGKKVVR